MQAEQCQKNGVPGDQIVVHRLDQVVSARIAGDHVLPAVGEPDDSQVEDDEPGEE